jgi:hypothetical protein
VTRIIPMTPSLSHAHQSST